MCVRERERERERDRNGRLVEDFSRRRRLGTLLAHSVSCTVYENKSFLF